MFRKGGARRSWWSLLLLIFGVCRTQGWRADEEELTLEATGPEVPTKDATIGEHSAFDTEVLKLYELFNDDHYKKKNTDKDLFYRFWAHAKNIAKSLNYAEIAAAGVAEFDGKTLFWAIAHEDEIMAKKMIERILQRINKFPDNVSAKEPMTEKSIAAASTTEAAAREEQPLVDEPATAKEPMKEKSIATPSTTVAVAKEEQLLADEPATEEHIPERMAASVTSISSMFAGKAVQVSTLPHVKDPRAGKLGVLTQATGNRLRLYIEDTAEAFYFSPENMTPVGQSGQEFKWKCSYGFPMVLEGKLFPTPSLEAVITAQVPQTS